MEPSEVVPSVVLTACAMFFASYFLLKKKKQGRVRRRRWWIRPAIQEKNESEFAWFVRARRTNHEEVFNFIGLEDWQFEHLLQMVRPQLEKRSNRPCIPPEMRLALTLR